MVKIKCYFEEHTRRTARGHVDQNTTAVVKCKRRRSSGARDPLAVTGASIWVRVKPDASRVCLANQGFGEMNVERANSIALLVERRTSNVVVDTQSFRPMCLTSSR